ncbi:MAG: hypothetical protein Sapg2KO_41700 [Saprospiraceae bacterium]
MVITSLPEIQAYPIDGFLYSGIRRILRLERILNGELKDTSPIPGAQKSIEDIGLNLYQTETGATIDSLPAVDPGLQKQVNALFPNLHESYSIAVLDISPNRPVRYAKRQENRGFQPGSVGKLAVVGALFCELENLYPDSFSQRIELLKTKMVKGGPWSVRDEHTVPFFNPEKNTLVKRQVNEQDIFSLFEWTDHMLSVSNNGAASVVWKEAILMRVFGKKYLTLTEEEANSYFSKTSKSELAEMATSVVNDPLRSLGINENEWRLGTMFTRGATAIIPGKGGSLGTPAGLMKWLLALEQGKVTDPDSSLEIKRLMYMTDRRIRYAANPALNDAAVYFKSGSLYKCNRETMPDCGKYMGNVDNYMNSVAIVEQDSSAVYIVALMSNVLRKNSNVDHNALGGKIHQMMMAEK